MVTEVKEKYHRTKEGLKSLMKTVQRELEDGKLKVEVLNSLVDVKEKLDNEVKESNG